MLSKNIVEAVKSQAAKHNIDLEGLLAVVEVESAGVPFWSVQGKLLPPIRFEGHYFYRRLSGSKLDTAIKQGLANKNTGGVKNPKSGADRYALLNRAAGIDKNAAMESTSWGLGQVMGANWDSLGYENVDELVHAALTIEGQIDMMVRYIRTNGIIDAVNKKEWRKFARVYNGPKYADLGYHTKLANAYAKYANSPTSDYKVGPDRSGIMQMQTMLNTVGKYDLKVDGVHGEKTEIALMDFQLKNGLKSDGIYGPLTKEELEKDYVEATRKKDDVWGKLGAGAGTIGTAATEAAKQIEPIQDQSQVLQWVFIGLTIVGIGLTLKATVWK